ncbi:BTB/POZ domain-containing protein At4g30940-like [Lycium ferocissimum]|uniref:BTB/POZ domain-containing protein At4g30940-like n=1 Tax=Lycium ferocissimum TaxID=112874 RepID=UPI002814DD67|nr:BTB/POZ domain-containing protein At4g30940-like [Lycium ferocissimum]
MGTPKDKVKLNVGGKIFETTATTLEIAGKNSLFGAMFDDNWNLHSDSAVTHEHFIDRDPDYFAVLLNLLRTGELYIPPNIDKKLLYREADYYGILDHVRSAEWGPFDGNRARLARSITGWPAADGEVAGAIRTSPSGWCCVRQGSVVRVYDWMLDEHPIIHTGNDKVNDVCWVDLENIAISSDEKLANGGMGLFNASTGKSRYKFQVTDKLNDLAPFATASTLAFVSDYKLFSSCENTGGDHGIGVWDLVTGKLIDFLHRPRYCKHEKAIQLQWLHGTNCLMALYLYPKNDIVLFDFRENNIVWSLANNRNKGYFCAIIDAITIEESSSICAVDWYVGLGFMDLRSTDVGVNWRTTIRPSSVACCPKLAFHEGQLFASMGNRIAVYFGSDWLLTSQLRHSLSNS